MFRSTHAIETFQLIKAAQELGHSKISTTMNNYLKPEENNLYLNEEKLRLIILIIREFWTIYLIIIFNLLRKKGIILL